MKHFITITLLTIAAAFITGCGPSGAVITGTVTYQDGAPLPRGMVVFGNEKHQFSAALNTDGTYRAGKDKTGKVPYGNYKVWIGSNEEREVTYRDPKDNAPLRWNTHYLVSPQYASPSQTILSFEVKAGNPTVFDFTVEKPKP